MTLYRNICVAIAPKQPRLTSIHYHFSDFLCDPPAHDKVGERIVVRPNPTKNVPFGELFELFLMTWSCLNSLGCVCLSHNMIVVSFMNRLLIV